MHFVIFKSRQEIFVDLHTDNINADPLRRMFWLLGIRRGADAALHSAHFSHPSLSQVFEVNLGKAFTFKVGSLTKKFVK